MPRTLCKSDKPLYLNIFPNWAGRQPVRFFMMENLLEARLGSAFPTNGAGYDEDVNVFLAGLLTDFLGGSHPGGIVSGAGGIMPPPGPELSRRQQAEYYLANANHRLLHLGLFNRGDSLRRRLTPFGLDDPAARLRDRMLGQNCYRMAFNLLEGRRLVPDGLVAILGKLAENFEDYVQVLAVMATRRLGLGARLDTGDLADLLEAANPEVLEQHPPRALPAGHPDMDLLLDEVLRYKANPVPEQEKHLRAAARRAGITPKAVLGQSGLKQIRRT